jgi:thioesterase domain-containing protein
VRRTAFAGSLFSLCVLTGWGATWLLLREQGLAGLIVVADSNIRYRKAVSSPELSCRCTPDADNVRTALEQFAAKGRASVDLLCTVDAGDKPAVTFTGKYVVQAQHT